MVVTRCTLREALEIIFAAHDIDDTNVFDMVDFLEEHVYDLNKVQVMMMIYTGQTTDFQLTRTIEDEKKKRSNKG
jgi:sulfur relay (sulfurtransferase) DsrF/TusC family protein